MIYVLALFMLMAGYYSLTYGISLWRDDRKRLGSVGVILISVLGTLIPIAFMFMRR
ncbi:hypothetical protein CLHUN_03840 [Ruminiclostridium hungatei]|uniref:Uncharacterized protein n=1 Tax=Ruminiclostridium hungatei TaxID=48256 RepID=A0A1V4SRJ6_RUMHU|nr:hypothetical protein [Ruminiclostridium hungatei]OPX45911.1 hypothetical protein CLHUN_03840 [Ruminiclostridium hungatei]